MRKFIPFSRDGISKLYLLYIVFSIVRCKILYLIICKNYPVPERLDVFHNRDITLRDYFFNVIASSRPSRPERVFMHMHETCKQSSSCWNFTL